MISSQGRFLAVAAILGTVGFASGCGGDDNGGGGSAKDESAMRATLVKTLTVNDPQVECVETVTKHFVSTVYGSLATCKKEETKPEDKPATGATLTDIKIDGDKATGTATVKGGDTNGASGELTFVKEDGAWKVDELSVGFLRSTLETGIAQSNEAPFNQPGFKDCVTSATKKLSDEEFRTVAYDAIGGRENKDFLKLLTGCLADSGGSTSTTTTDGSSDGEVSGLRKKFEEGVAESAKADGKSQAEIDCITKALRTSITDDDIIAQIGKSQKDIDPKVTKATANAIIDCAK